VPYAATSAPFAAAHAKRVVERLGSSSIMPPEKAQPF
jgi:hypothetical protein